jgi:hypothetical protein
MYKSIAVWPESISLGTPDNSSEDTYTTKEQAEAVCRLLERHGFGGNGKVFPISTRVEYVS